MKNSEIPSELNGFGLSNYEIKSYLSLLEKKQMTASEVSRLAGVPFGRIYDVLDQLSYKGLCQKIAGKVKLYSAVDPSQLKDVLISIDREKSDSKIEKLESQIELEKEQLAERIKSTENIVEKLMPIFEKSRGDDDPLDCLEVVKTPLQIRRKYSQLCRLAKKEILVFVKPPFSYTSQEQKDEEDNSMDVATDKGVRIRAILELSENKAERDAFYAQSFGEDSNDPEIEEVKCVPKLPIKLAIFDAKVVLFTISNTVNEQSSITSLVAENDALAGSFKELFELYWAKARYLSEEDHKR